MGLLKVIHRSHRHSSRESKMPIQPGHDENKTNSLLLFRPRLRGITLSALHTFKYMNNMGYIF